MGKPKKQAKNRKETAPLLLPTPYPMFPYRDGSPDFIKGVGDYLLTGEDYIALRDTVGYPPNKSKLKVFLARKCKVSDPINCSFPDITETLRFYLEEKSTSKSTGKKKALPNDLITLSVAEQKYHVSRPTLMRAIKNGRLQSNRPKNCSKNHQHKVSESQVASIWQTRQIKY